MSKEIEYRKEQFLKNPDFLRLTRSYELYQNLFREADFEKKGILKERMYKVFRKEGLPDENEPGVYIEELRFAKELDAVCFKALQLCEDDKFTPEALASVFAGSLVAERFLELWNPEEGKEDGSLIMVNEAVAYRVEEDNSVSVHIRPTPVSGTDNLLIKIVEGFSNVAQKIKKGELSSVENVTMESWMLAGDMLEKAKAFLGDDVDVDEAESSDQNVFLPLQYNARSLEKYLTSENEKDGLPKIGKVVMTKEQFLNRFG